MDGVRCAVVDQTTKLVENVIIADPTSFTLPGFIIIASDTANIGDTYANNQFTPGS